MITKDIHCLPVTPLSKMLLSTVLISKDDKRVSKNKDVEAARCRVSNGYQVLMLSIDSKCP